MLRSFNTEIAARSFNSEIVSLLVALVVFFFELLGGLCVPTSGACFRTFFLKSLA